MAFFKKEQTKAKTKKKQKGVSISWGNKGVSSQNSMSDNDNPYNHVGGKQLAEDAGDIEIDLRGDQNHAPQKDLQLGERSITHKKIAEKLSYLNAGSGIEFYVDNPESDSDNLSSTEKLELDEANSWIEKGLGDAIKVVSNGLTYQNLANIVVKQDVPRFVRNIDEVVGTPARFISYPSEWMRYSSARMNASGSFEHQYHAYHRDWLYDPKKEKDKGKPKMPDLISINEYISKSNGKEDLSDVGWYIKNIDTDKSAMEQFVSMSVDMGKGIFDKSYPLPSWKASSSINDIQAEFESSCIRIDYLRNGLHVFAIVNVYSTSYNLVSESDFDSVDEEWAEDVEIVKNLKKSYNAGTVIVNPLGTKDPNMDGKIEIEKVELSFPVDQVKYFNEEARSAILTAWGQAADLFSITKPEKNNLRSQEGFLKLSIMLLQESVRIVHQQIELAINKLLLKYGLTLIKSRVVPHKNNIYLSVMADFAKEFMTIEEVRSMILNLPDLTEEEKETLLAEKGISVSQEATQ